MSVVTPITVAHVNRNQDLEVEVVKIWYNIVKHIEDVLTASKLGFKLVAEWADPSIEEIVERITKIDGLLNSMLDGAVGVVSDECEVQLMNCQNSLHLIRRVHVALKQNNQHEYDDVIFKLTSQRK